MIIDESTLILIFCIVFLLISVYDIKWGTIGGITWIVGSLTSFIYISQPMGLIGIGIGMLLETFAIIKVWENL